MQRLLIPKVLAALVLVGGCHQGPSIIRVVESRVVDSLLAAAPHTLIDLDALEEQIWYPDKVITLHNDTEYASSEISFVIVRDSFYISDFQEDAIFVAGMDGTIHRKIGRKGEGPLEFHNLSELAYAGEHFFALEPSRTQVLSKDLRYVTTTDPVESGGFASAASATDARLYVGCGSANIFRVCPRSAHPPFQELSPFLPSLQIPNMGVMESVELVAAPDGSLIFISFIALPYLFVFNEHHEHIHTLALIGKRVEEHDYRVADSELPVGTTMSGNVGSQMRPLLRDLYMIGHNLVAVRIFRSWYFIRISDHNTFTHVATAQLGVTPAEGSDTLWRSSVARLYRDTLYVSSIRTASILRFPLQILASAKSPM